ncbi:MAG: rod shape-determining protein MreD [Spirochaetes bacterium]|jgi:rod shape-determining protein MreD|nr:rod shape-determining protein MreD [Spirochaetota bacterium]
MIVTYILTAALVLASLIVQGHSSFEILRIAGCKPDLIFIVIVYMAYNFGSFYGETTGFIAGIFHDAISNSPLGLLAFPKMLLGYVVGFFGRSVFRQNILTVALLIFLSSLLKGVVTLFLAYLFHTAAVSSLVHVVFPESFYNALLAPPLFFLFDKLFEKELAREGY